ncbi:hypothetical protein O0I10_009880 [Lichtheimia ornata]|uniref:Uncharacterized protein n=1 Tax=Lichtheimia ornata TaxID=688661 RepID=A0AAD7XRU0_9FUNG|nr:uncharacterized protein O0I10_009880 [Lichtheimia ornata]KAJ8654439.1 hypothetical protein O0I10_009880 [Lichtheimia ornata]
MPTTPQTTATSWQTEISHFFQELGLIETEKCFNNELVILSQQHLQQLPTVLERLADRLLHLLEQHVQAKEVITSSSTATPDPAVIAENEQKLLYNKKRKRENEEEEEEERMRQLDSEQVQIRATRQEIQQRINSFIQAKQNEVDASNRTEFLNRADPTSSDITCARADAREINRNIQMKFDIVNNEDGPLARSRLQEASSSSTTTTGAAMATDQQLHKERVQNIEQHMNVVFDPNADPPFSVPERLRILEDRIMTIEREHPKWAAVHFQQPHRSYPPPPPAVAITRPGAPAYLVSQMTPPPEVKTTGRGNSSLTRAVLEQLHRQKQAKGINHTSTTINTEPSSTSSSS